MNTQHQWYTLENGSQSYRKLLIEPFKDRIQINNGAVKVKTLDGKAIVTTQDGKTHTFDKVIFACHADQTLKLLESPIKLGKPFPTGGRYK